MTAALPPSVADVERRIQHLILGLSEGRLPADEQVDDLRRAVAALAREGGVPSWRLEEFGSAVRVLARKVVPGGRHAATVVPAPRSAVARPRRPVGRNRRTPARRGARGAASGGRTGSRRRADTSR